MCCTNIVVTICPYKNLYQLIDKIKKYSDFLCANGVKLVLYLSIQWLNFHLPFVDTHTDGSLIVSTMYILCSA